MRPGRPAVPRAYPPLGHLERTGRMGHHAPGQHVVGQRRGLLPPPEDSVSGDQGRGSGAASVDGGPYLFLGLAPRPAALPGSAAGYEIATNRVRRRTVTTSTRSPITSTSIPARRPACWPSGRRSRNMGSPTRRCGSTRPTRGRRMINRSRPGRARVSASPKRSRRPSCFRSSAWRLLRASRVEFYKLRNSADHPESIEPFGLLRADDSPRPALAAYRVAATYLRDFRTAIVERQGDVVAVTFDRGDRTMTVLWTNNRRPAHVTVRAIATGPSWSMSAARCAR